MVTASELRERARGSLKGRWLPSVLVVFIITVIVSALNVSEVINTVKNIGIEAIPTVTWYGTVLSIISFVISGALSYGQISYFVNLTRGNNATLSDAFSGFSKLGKTFVLNLLIGIFTFLWTLLFIIPGIIKVFAYSMSYYVLRDNPDMTATEAITESRQLMDGNKFRLFCLQLSFIGWAFLGAITIIGIFWVQAYIMAANAEFYNQILSEKRGEYNTQQ